MNIKKFKFVECLMCDARWYEITEGRSAEDRLKMVEELWLRFECTEQSDEFIAKYIEETVYADY